MLANFWLAAKNGRRILDNNGSYIFYCSQLIFYPQWNGRIFFDGRKNLVAKKLFVALAWSQAFFGRTKMVACDHFLGLRPKKKPMLALMVKEREMIFYTFDFLSAGSDDDHNEVMIEKFSLNQLKFWYIIA